MTFTHTWRYRNLLGDRHGQPCRIVAASRKPNRILWTGLIVNAPRMKNMGSILVEFCDGFRVVTSRHAVRRIA